MLVFFRLICIASFLKNHVCFPYNHVIRIIVSFSILSIARGSRGVCCVPQTKYRCPFSFFHSFFPAPETLASLHTSRDIWGACIMNAWLVVYLPRRAAVILGVFKGYSEKRGGWCSPRRRPKDTFNSSLPLSIEFRFCGNVFAIINFFPPLFYR